MAKVLVVSVFRYNAHEFWGTLGTLQKRGLEFEVVAPSGNEVRDEVGGGRISLQRDLKAIPREELVEFDGIIIVSGQPKDTAHLWRDMAVRRAVVLIGTDKPAAAICAAAPAIRYVADGKKVAAYPLMKAKELLMQAGAILTTASLVIDQNVVTAEHQLRTTDWANAFADLVEGKEPSTRVIDTGFVPKQWERRPAKPLREAGWVEEVTNDNSQV